MIDKIIVFWKKGKKKKVWEMVIVICEFNKSEVFIIRKVGICIKIIYYLINCKNVFFWC